MPTSQRIQITPENLVKWTRVVSISELKPHPRNPRIGNAERVGDSLDAHGQFRSIGVSEDFYVLFGNHTYQAAMAKGMTTIAVHVLPLHHDDAQAVEIMLADNHSSDGSSYDNQLLVEAIQAAEAEYDSIAATLYTEDEYSRLLANLEKGDEKPKKDPDDVAAPPAKAVTVPGDVWRLGPHLLVCGDATDPAAYETLLGDDKADMVWTDPPYGVDVNGDDKKQVKRRKDGRKVSGDKLDNEGLLDLLNGTFSLALAYCEAGACWYVASPPGPLNLIFASVLVELDILRQSIIWVKNALVQGRSDYQYRHEPILYGWHGDGHHRVSDRTQTSVWEIDRPTRSPMHPTIKPVELVLRAIQNSTGGKAIILDPFAGSGTTVIACHLTNRVARVIELDPIYCDVICRRFQEQVGILPVLDKTGIAHDFIVEAA